MSWVYPLSHIKNFGSTPKQMASHPDGENYEKGKKLRRNEKWRRLQYGHCGAYLGVPTNSHWTESNLFQYYGVLCFWTQEIELKYPASFFFF